MHERVGELLPHVAAQVYAQLAQVPLALGGIGYARGGLHVHLHTPWVRHGVGHEHRVARAVEVVAVVAEERGQPRALGIQGGSGERAARLQAALGERSVDEAVGKRRVAYILHGIDGVQPARGDDVAYLCLQRVLLRNDAVAHLGVEVSIGPQQVLGHEGTRLGGDVAEQHGRRAELGAHPPPELRVGLGVLVVHRELQLQRRTVVRAAQQRAVGLAGQGRLHLVLDAGEVQVGVSHGIFGLLHARVEHLAFGQVARR